MPYTTLFKHNKISKIKLGTLIALVTIFATAGVVSAESLVITGNGSGSSSNITSANNQAANVSQNNDSDVNNNIQTESNTGGNDTSDNVGGENSIETGNSTIEVDITNTGNTNSSELGCCYDSAASDGLVDISGNGAGSHNTTNINSTSITNVTLSNTASITNNITGYASTGNNSANGNTSGNVYIKTGHITVSERITNGPLNFNDTSSMIGSIKSGDYKLAVAGNGSHSSNLINFDLFNQININTNNTLDILNDSIWLLNTGNNHAKDNTGGSVNILTGDISFIANILNGPINVNKVEVKCCEEKEVEQPTGGVTPITPPTAAKVESKPSETKPSDGPKSGEVLGASVESVLPITGNYLFLLLMIGNVAMFLLGMVLRLRSGRSPGLSGVVA